MVEKNATFPGVIGEMVQPVIPAVLTARGRPRTARANGPPAGQSSSSARVASRAASIDGLCAGGFSKVARSEVMRKVRLE